MNQKEILLELSSLGVECQLIFDRIKLF